MKLKKSTKRQPLANKYMVQKRIATHRKKMRKTAKLMLRKKHRKDPGIPNSWPFKGEMLQEIHRNREKIEEEKKAEKLRKRAEKRELMQGQNDIESQSGDEGNVDDAVMSDGEADEESSGDEEILEGGDKDVKKVPQLVPVGTTYADLRSAAEDATLSYEATMEKEREVDEGGEMPKRKTKASTTAFAKELRKVIEMSDVLVEVLDARNPQACRDIKLEDSIVAEGKKLVLVVNKIDLVPQAATDAWVKHFRKSYPCVAFKAAVCPPRGITQVQAKPSDLSESQLKVGSYVVGAQALVTLLKNYARSGSSSVKTSITAGFIGVPNVGKSSILNSLCRNVAGAKTGGEAGVTRRLQEIFLDKKVKLIDCPGVILQKGLDASMEAELVLRNAIKISTIKNPIDVVDQLVSRGSPEMIMKLFMTPFFKTTDDFLKHVAVRRGRLGPGGVPDLQAAAVIVLTEYTSGKVQHYCLPPAEDEANAEAMSRGEIQAPRIVSALAKAFDIDALTS